MFDFIGSRMQKAIAKANKKTQLKEEHILEITRDIRRSKSWAKKTVYLW